MSLDPIGSSVAARRQPEGPIRERLGANRPPNDFIASRYAIAASSASPAGLRARSMRKQRSDVRRSTSSRWESP